MYKMLASGIPSKGPFGVYTPTVHVIRVQISYIVIDVRYKG
jgi:hypothetical protein